MSFRKRSVRPNLNLSKRPAPAAPVQVDKVAENIPDDEKPAQEKRISGQDDAVTVSVPKQDVEIQLGLTGGNNNDREEACSTPAVGKRLSKRTKVTPKLTQQKKKCDVNNIEVNASPLCSQTSSPYHLEKPNNVDIPTHVKNSSEKTFPIQCKIAESIDHEGIDKEGEKSSEDVISVNLLATKNKDRNENLLDCSVESESKSAACISNDSSKTEVAKENKLHKRVKVTPKLASRSLNKRNNDITVGKDVGSVSEQLLVKDTSSLPDNNKKTDIDNQDDICNNISGEYDSRPFSGDSTVNDDIEKCVETSFNISSNTLQNESMDVTISNDKKDDTTPSKTSRLQKRVKIKPKLKGRISTISHEKEDHESNDIINLDTNKPIIISENYRDDVETIISPLTQTIDKEINSVVDNEINWTKNYTEVELQRNHGIVRDENINLIIDSTPEVDKNNETIISPLTQTIDKEINSVADNEMSWKKNDTEVELQRNHSIISDENINLIIDSTPDEVDKNKEPSLDISNHLISDVLLASFNSELGGFEKKHVRFTSDEDVYKNIYYNENSNDYENEATSKQSLCDNIAQDDDVALKLPNCVDNRNEKYDSNDEYDSLSEGEILGKQLASKNKVFKPNLGAKRRERLSSFSAYSSCDEDDWQNQKKRKKEKSKKYVLTSDGSNEDDSKKQVKKKKLKHPAKQKKNRENLEPNVEKVQKKREKKPKPEVLKTPKCEEERDLSTLTMQELIHYNHPSFKTVELRSKRDEDENEHVVELGNVTPAVPSEQKPNVDQKPEDEVMAPQIMINEDGEIVINQASLTISQQVDDTSLKSSAVVYEDSLSYGTHLKRKHVVGKRWKIDETLRFYKALSEIGTDFTLMSQAFGRFSRNELKKKFKKEEKVNCDLVDRALSNRLPLNMEMFLQGKEEMGRGADEKKDGDTVIPEVIERDNVATEAIAVQVVTPDGDICIAECDGEGEGLVGQ